MKGTGKTLLIIATISCFALFYVHLQTSSFLISYDINKYSETFSEKKEAFRHLKFEVNKLKAPRLLDEKISEHELSLKLPSTIDVIEMPNAMFKTPVGKEIINVNPLTSVLSNFWGQWIRVAQAKTETAS